MFCKQLIPPGTKTYHSYPQQTLRGLHNTDNIQLCVWPEGTTSSMNDLCYVRGNKDLCQSTRMSFMYGLCTASVHISDLLHSLSYDTISITDRQVKSLSTKTKSDWWHWRLVDMRMKQRNYSSKDSNMIMAVKERMDVKLGEEEGKHDLNNQVHWVD